MKLMTFDIKTAFLYGELKEDIFMHQPEGFNDGTDRICKLKYLWPTKKIYLWPETSSEKLEQKILKVSGLT